MYPQRTRVVAGLWRHRGRLLTQIVLIVISVVAALGATFRMLERGGTAGFFGPRVEAVPSKGPVGMAPFIELHGFDKGREVAVYLCAGPTGAVDDCVELARGEAPGPLRSKPIPEAFPTADEIVPASYVLRAGPDDTGEFPVRGNFEVSSFDVGARARPRSFAGVVPQAIRIGEGEEIARSAPCRPPIFLPDGRLAVGATVVDSETGVTIHFNLPATELAWSPVGDKLAILTPDRKEIRLAGPDGADAVTAVREARGLLSSLSWSPSGDSLAFISQNDPSTRGGPGPPTVRILNAVTSQVASAGPGIAVSWSTKADLLAVERADGAIETSTPTGERRRLISGRSASWSPDGSLIAFVAPVEGQDDGWIARADGADASPVIGEASAEVCAVSFSPSGQSFAVVTKSGEETSLTLHPIEVQR